MLLLLLSLACSDGKSPMACGPDEVCAAGEYCEVQTGAGTQEVDSAGDPIGQQRGDTYSCEEVPSDCGDAPSCDCLDCSECEEGGVGGVPTCTEYRP